MTMKERKQSLKIKSTRFPSLKLYLKRTTRRRFLFYIILFTKKLFVSSLLSSFKTTLQCEGWHLFTSFLTTMPKKLMAILLFV